MKARAFSRHESSLDTRIWERARLTYAFLFRSDPRQHTWPPCRPSRFWQRHAKTRATMRNAWDSEWSLCRSLCQLFRPQRWVIRCEGKDAECDNVALRQVRHFNIVSLAIIMCRNASHSRLVAHGRRYDTDTEMHRRLILKLFFTAPQWESRVSLRMFF